MTIPKIKTEIIFVTLLLVIGVFLRFYNLNWDSGHFFHPDERNIANAVSRIIFFDDLNPQFFAYGGFSIYLYKAAGDLLTFLTNDTPWTSDWAYINMLGRFFSALFSTLTIIPLYFLAKKVFNKQTAAIATIIYTFTVASIQTAHFDTTESILSLLIVSLALFSVNFLEKPNIKNSLGAALVLGLAGASKTTAFSYIIFPAISFFLVLIKYGNRSKLTLYGLAFLALAGITFTLFSPYTFISWDKFMESMRYESGVATGSLPVPYTLQFTHTLPYLFQLKNFFWQIGPTALFIVPGFLWLLWEAIYKKEGKYVLLLSFPLIYFAYAGAWHTKFIRYMMPVIPFFIIFASYFLSRFSQTIYHTAHHPHQLPAFIIYILRVISSTWKVTVVLLLGLTILWSLAFFSIYTREQTRITASQWIYDNIPAGSVIYGEHWDDGLPVPLPNLNPSQYQGEALTIYEPDNEDKLSYYIQKLSQGDYIILSSRRLYGTLINLPDKYPLTSKYYQLLFSGHLGYEKVAEFTSYPSLFGLEVNDDASEETFQVYDHPKVIIFKNIRQLNYGEYLQILGND